ncbi:hypothetical protein EPUL_002889 [Erysiphe pulchra]|uniref:Uncharacterized protein n=1 Tax=Erysiphe pulchra TaxID=225359 RepID=A0A2S4PZ91_9PEZI|nr:hypothetical protein EPUL_002889 [Erysiphe pulchra]
MLPQISGKDNSDHVLLGLQTNGNPSHESQSTRDSSQSYFIAADENVETLSSNKSGDSKETLNNHTQPDRNRKRVQAFAQPSSKTRRTNSYRQTTLCVELPSKYDTPKSLSLSEPQKSCFVSLSSTKMAGSTMVSKTKTPQKEFSNGRAMSNRISRSRSNQLQSQEGINLGKSYSIDKKKMGLSIYSQIATKSLDHSASSHKSSRGEGDVSICKASNSKNHHEPSHKSISSSSESEDPLTSSTSVGHFHLKALNFPRKSVISSNSSPITQSVSLPKQKYPHLSAIKNSTNEDPTSSKSYQLEKSNPILIDLLSSPDIEQIPETIEKASTPHLRPRKNKAKPPGIQKSKKKMLRFIKTYLSQIPFIIHLNILRKHVYAAHGKKHEDGRRRCLWGKCSLAWKDTHIEKLAMTSPDTNVSVVDSSLIYLKRRDWKNHMEENHLIPFSWHMGDGPCGSRLAKPSTVWHQPYLFFADGRQITPSVASQPIEKGIVRKLNASRFHWQQGGPFGSEILVPISQPIPLSSNIIPSGSHVTMDEEEADQELFDEPDQIAEIRDVYKKKRRKDEDDFIPSDF